MTSAHVECDRCEHEWHYRGISAESCFCPNCSKKNKLDGPNVDVVESFGFADDLRSFG